MIKPALVIMAAGMGSRYGGLKQIDPVGPNGEKIIDYSIYDALKAGFGKVVFIIKKEMEETFREVIGDSIEKQADVEYAFQSIDDLPGEVKAPEERKKPWGTAHAVLSCRKAVDTPFAVINADDFYGYTSFKVLYDFLSGMRNEGKCEYGMVGFILENTLTEHGHVARGVCTVDEHGYLKEIHERTKIMKMGNMTKYAEGNGEWIAVPEGSIVSMNTWGFTPEIFKELEVRFPAFLEINKDNLTKAEYFLPAVVDSLIAENKAKVKVLPSQERWYGVTYREDKAVVAEAVSRLIRQGVYPERLWEGFK